MKKWDKKGGTMTKQALNRDITAFSRGGASVCMWNIRKSVEMRIRSLKQRNNGMSD